MLGDIAYWVGFIGTVISYTLWTVLDVAVYIVGLYTIGLWLLHS